MAIKTLDTLGLQCPEPILQIAVKSADLQQGDILQVVSDCPTFENDVRLWCKRLNKQLLFIRSVNGKKECQIQF
jgi:tRNA 2-thiouridine synthesizing protein A